MNPTAAAVAIIAAILGGLAGIAALIRTFLERPKIRADAMSVVNAAAVATLGDLRQDADTLRAEVAQMRTENRALDDRLNMMESREDRYIRAIRLLVGYTTEMHEALSKAHLVPPPHPISPQELERLLSRFSDALPRNGASH
jgi:chromosome segregation ATPase